MVSHDVSLMNASVNSIADITAGTLLEYRMCTYTQCLDEKEFRAQSAQAECQKKLGGSRHQAFVDKFGADTKSKSWVKALEKMRAEGKFTPPPVAIISNARIPELVLPPPPKLLGGELNGVETRRYRLRSRQNAAARRYFVRNPPRGMKLCCSGEPNGAEKSTLLKALPGNVPEMILRGEDTYNEQLRLGVFTPDGWWIW